MRVTVEGAELSRGDRRLVIDRWSVPAGARLCLHGASGCGKTSALHLLAGVLVPSRGEVTVGQTRLSSLSEPARDAFRAHHVGYVFQDFNLLPGLTAVENVSLPRGLRGDRSARPRARALLERMGLDALGDREAAQLSRGERQRVAVARALAGDPGLILADEPTASLDAAARDAVLDALLDASGDATLVVVTHDPAVQARFETRVDAQAILRWEAP